jgi:anthranilate phosphoribosyltransferase
MEYAQFLEKIISGQALTETEAFDLMNQILAGRFSGEKIAGLLTALRCKGETYDEVVGFVRSMRANAVRLETTAEVVDTCGTGGDGAATFNISTTAAFIAAGAGVPIAKHHNRSVSSRCGSADVLEELGIDISMSPQKVTEAVEKIGIGFCFAPLYHQSMKHVAPARKELGIRTVFNMLGPLLNPFLAKRQVIGVFAPHLTDFFATILQKLGSESVFIVHGEDGLDEVTLCDRTQITQLQGNLITTRQMTPEEFGFQRVDSVALVGGDKSTNAKILRDILTGVPGPKRDVAVLNAALAITCSGKTDSIHTAVKMAQEAIDSGAALQKLNQLIEFSGSAA